MKRAVFLLPIIVSGCNGQDHASITCFQPSKVWIAACQAPNAHNVIENVIVVEPNGSVLVNGDEAKSRQFDAFLDDIKAKQFKPYIYLVQQAGGDCNGVNDVRAKLDDRHICEGATCIIGDPREQPPGSK